MSTARVWVADIPLGPYLLSFATFKGRQICFEMRQTESPTGSPVEQVVEGDVGGDVDESGGDGGERRVLRAPAPPEGLQQLESNPKAKQSTA